MSRVTKIKAISSILPVFIFIILLPFSAQNFSISPFGKYTGLSVVISVCPKCVGTGNINCPSCGDKGISDCITCSGEGDLTVDCKYCSGHKTINGYTCPSCRGIGTNVVKCSKCSGKGGFRCTLCGFSGVIKCDNCGGSGTTFERKSN